jgi:phospholipase/carboxylesterase
VVLTRLQRSHHATARDLAPSEEALDTPLSPPDLSNEPGSATGRSGAYPDGTFTRRFGPAFRTQHVLSLRAPYRLGPDAYGWFSFDVHPDGQRVIDTRQEAASRQAVALTARSAAEQLAVPARRVVIGGFSQGGIMALSILLTRPDLLTAAMVMHSRLLPETVPLIASEPDLLGRKLWVSHGTQDQVIPLSSAHDIRDRLRQLPIELSYAEFPGGHEIRPAELAAAMAWLQALAAAG